MPVNLTTFFQVSSQPTDQPTDRPTNRPTIPLLLSSFFPRVLTFFPFLSLPFLPSLFFHFLFLPLLIFLLSFLSFHFFSSQQHAVSSNTHAHTKSNIQPLMEENTRSRSLMACPKWFLNKLTNVSGFHGNFHVLTSTASHANVLRA